MGAGVRVAVRLGAGIGVGFRVGVGVLFAFDWGFGVGVGVLRGVGVGKQAAVRAKPGIFAAENAELAWALSIGYRQGAPAFRQRSTRGLMEHAGTPHAA